MAGEIFHSSRAVQQVSEGKGGVRRSARGGGRRDKEEGGQQFVGSILLRFRYSTSRDSQRQEEEEGEEEERVDGEEVQLAPVNCVACAS